MRSLSERGKYEMSTANETVNYLGRRSDYGKEISHATIANYTRNIKVFFSHLHQEKVIGKNPMKAIKNVKPERKMKVTLTYL